MSRTVLFLDHGLFVGAAQRFARLGWDVKYAPTWKSSYPSSNQHDIGVGLDGIEVVDDVWEVILKDSERWAEDGEYGADGMLKNPAVDLVVCPDLYFPGEVTMLRNLGYPTWGAGLSSNLKQSGEDLEIDRIKWKKMLVDLGLPYAPYNVCRGDEALEAYIKSHAGRHYVKGSKCRADFESQECLNLGYIQAWLRDVRDVLGERVHNYDFIVERALENAIEAAWDTFCIRGEFPTCGLLGVEQKCLAYCAHFTDAIPEQFTAPYSALSSYLRRTGYRQFFSIETLIEEDGTPNPSDVCARVGLPCGASQLEGYENIDDVMVAGAAGEVLDPKPTAPYCVELVLQSMSHKRQVVPLPKDLEECTYLINCWKSKAGFEVMPQPRIRTPSGLACLGTVVAMGKSLDEACEKCAEYGKELASLSADLEVTPSAFDDIKKKFDDLANRGVAL